MSVTSRIHSCKKYLIFTRRNYGIVATLVLIISFSPYGKKMSGPTNMMNPPAQERREKITTPTTTRFPDCGGGEKDG